MTIRNPIEWGWDHLKSTAHEVGAAGSTVHHAHHAPIAVRSINVGDLGQALNRGLTDFASYRTDVVMMCLIYPVVGLVLYHLVTGYEMLPLLFPLASGFALIGPIAGMGLYEMSRRREEGHTVDWGTAFGVLRAPSFGAILTLTLLLTAIFVLWLTAAAWIYESTMRPELPASMASFVNDVLYTSGGHHLIAIGCGVGFLFAVLTLMISVISFPLLLDRDVGVDAAIWASIRACLKNPVTMTVWGMIVAAGLIIGSLPFFVGLIVVLPVLGHSTWHLYRRIVRPDTGPPHHHHRPI